jgi:hypothetical protein
MGIAGYSLTIICAFVLIVTIIYFATGIGKTPHVEMDVTVHENTIILTIHKGNILAKNWEYLVFDERFNPPVVWSPGITDIESGKNATLKTNLNPVTYHVQIKHIASAEFILDTKVVVGEYDE